jgi:alkylation response protein AidB-like acyl-CoA dehydrogenase
MILELRNDLVAFRAAVRDWLAQAVPRVWRAQLAGADSVAAVGLQRNWIRKLHSVGLAIPHWPAIVGGGDLGLAHQIIIAEENARADAPPLPAYVVSLNHVPATLLAWGTHEQKRRYLPTVAEGAIWCQGFSEPNAGSDLAALRTRAVRDGDHYVVTGQKIWSSQSMHADYCILLTRTSSEGKKQAGITYFVLSMHAPGVEVRPIRQSNGRAEFGELFLHDVRIPVADRVSGENEGWAVAQSTLAAERGVLAFEGAERYRYLLEAFHARAVAEGAAWLRDDAMRREFMGLFAELQATRRMIRKLLREADHNDAHGQGQRGFSMTPSIVKVVNTMLKKRVGAFLVRCAGAAGQLDLGDQLPEINPMLEYITTFGQVIAAGTNEIQRNLIAERGLGLPRS